MARQNKVTTFGEIIKGQAFQIVNNGFAGVVYTKRDHWTARVVESGWDDRPVGFIVDVRRDTFVTRCMTKAQKEQRRNRMAVTV